MVFFFFIIIIIILCNFADLYSAFFCLSGGKVWDVSVSILYF